MTSAPDYIHGHHDSVLRSHRWRTAENSAAYLLGHLHPGDALLDVGCGPGTITIDLARLLPEGHVVGIDASAEVIAEARRAAREAGVTNVDFHVADLYALGDLGECFDVVHAHQVLQHVADPIAALRSMCEACRADGIVAARDSDYGAFAWYPSDPELDQWLAVYRASARLIGGEPDAGRRLVAWARAAGLSRVDASASCWCFSGDADRTWWSDLWAERVTASHFAETARSAGLASEEDLERIAAAWRRWGAAPDACFILPSGEVLCRP